MRNRFYFAFLSLLISGCDLNSNLLPLDQYEKVEVIPVFFYEYSDESVELRQVTGASACRRSAFAFSSEKGLDNTAWTYLCYTVDGKHKIR